MKEENLVKKKYIDGEQIIKEGESCYGEQHVKEKKLTNGEKTQG